ncbi:hypothetical protein PIB30_080483, partial [Stylosanthes scabra]|nr:hypothetical protein [Stylosanthes scabra]
MFALMEHGVGVKHGHVGSMGVWCKVEGLGLGSEPRWNVAQRDSWMVVVTFGKLV